MITMQSSIQGLEPSGVGIYTMLMKHSGCCP